MPAPPSTSLNKILASCVGLAAFLAALVWGVGAGVGLGEALLRSIGIAVLMFLLGLILGRAAADVFRETPAPGGSEKKRQEEKKGP